MRNDNGKKNKFSFSKLLLKAIKLILNCLKKFEVLSSNFKFFGMIYDKLFYAKLINNEFEMADLKADAKIVHIGSGPFPITAISLARKGYEVTGVDVDESALNKARDSSEELGLSEKIKFKLAEIEEIDFSSYDAIWASLHVIPKAESINEIIEQLSSNQKLIYRNPRGLLTFLYDKVKADQLTDKKSIVCKQPLGKESVLIKF